MFKNRLIDAKKGGYTLKKCQFHLCRSTSEIPKDINTFLFLSVLDTQKRKKQREGQTENLDTAILSFKILTTTTTFAVTQSCLRGNRGTVIPFVTHFVKCDQFITPSVTELSCTDDCAYVAHTVCSFH